MDLAGGWDELLTAIMPRALLTMLTITGALIILFSLLSWLRRLQRGKTSRFPIIAVMLGVLLAAPMVFIPLILWVLGSLFEAIDSGNDTEPSAEPIPTPTATPDPTPTSKPDPVVLPEVQNLPTLLLIVAILALLVMVFFVGRRIRLDRLERKKLHDAEVAEKSRLQAKWTEVVKRHEALKAKYLDAEMNWDMLFSYPALTDPTVSLTAAMLRAMQAADDADAEMPASFAENDTVSSYPYPKLVGAFAVAWRAAEQNAKRIGQSLLPAEERKTIKLIQTLLSMAENSGAAPTERQMAYERIQKLFKTLKHLSVPERAMRQIEERRQLALEST